MTPQKHDDGGRKDNDELHRTPEPIHEDYRYMIRSTYNDVRELKSTIKVLTDARTADNVRIDRLEQSHKNSAWFVRALAGTAIAAVGTTIWTLISGGHIKPPSAHP